MCTKVAPRPGSVPGRLGIAVAVSLVAACLGAEAAVLRVGIDDLDEGYFIQQAARVFAGQVPFRDFETLYSPGLAYAHAALFAALSGPDLLAPRALALLARGGMCAILFALTRPLVRQPLWAAAPALFLLIGLDDAPVRWEPHPGWPSTFFGLFTMWLVARGPRWALVSGASAAAAYLFKQNTGAFVFGALIVWAVACWRDWRATAGAVGGFAVLTGLWVAPLVLAMNGDVDDLGVLVGRVNERGLFSPPEVSLLIPVLCVAAGALLARRDSDPRLRWYLLAGGALFLTEFPRMDALHLAWSAPGLLVLGAVALDRMRAALALPLLATALALTAPTIASRVSYLAAPLTPFRELRIPAPTASALTSVLDDIDRNAAPGEPIFVYPTAPLLYVLSSHPNPTRFDHLNPGAAAADQIQRVIDDLQRARARVVVVDEFWRNYWGAPGPNAPLEAWLQPRFHEVARSGPYRVLAADL